MIRALTQDGKIATHGRIYFKNYDLVLTERIKDVFGVILKWNKEGIIVDRVEYFSIKS